MIIAVTGTPGTGKTSVATLLADMLGYEYVAVNDVVNAASVETRPDPDRDTLAVDPDNVVAELQRVVADDAVLDGHLSHHFPADITVVLRCHPDELGTRLQNKGWEQDKIAENVEAEVLDVVLRQAVDQRDRVHELDTTGKTPEQVAEAVKKIVTHPETDASEPGTVSWDMEQYYGD